MLLAGVVLKFVPVNVTVSPGLAAMGLKEVIVVWARIIRGNHTVIIKLKTTLKQNLIS
jgi:hypothetical protein